MQEGSRSTDERMDENDETAFRKRDKRIGEKMCICKRKD